jgi:hypothetical protein
MSAEEPIAGAPGPLELAPRRRIDGPLDMLRLIIDSPLRSTVKLFAVALVRRCNSKTWSWPRNPSSSSPRDYGVGVKRLAEDISRCTKTVQRCMKALEQQGLAQRHYRGGRTNGYQLHIEAWRDYAERFDAERARREAAEESDRQAQATEAWLRETGVQALVDDPSVGLEDEAGESAPVNPTPAPEASGLPRWALDRARYEGQDPHQVYSLVGAVVSLVESDADARSMGGIAKAVMRLWRSRGYPTTGELVAQLRLMVRAAQHAPGWQWRDLRERGWGEVPLTDIRRLLAPSRFAERVQGAQEWAEVLDADLDQPGLLRRVLGASGAVPWPAAQVLERWSGVLEVLRTRLDPLDVQIWLGSGVEGAELVDGVLWLEVVSQTHADWIAGNYQAVLVELVGGPVGLAWPSG